MAIKVTVTGDKELVRAVRARAKVFPGKVKRALYREAETIMTDSKENYVPVDQSILKNSGHVIMDKTRIAVHLLFGGLAEAYAVVQHEVLTFHHTVGGPKYLERPLLARAATILQSIARRVKL